MRLLTVIAEMGSGGAESVVHDLCSRLPRCGVEVALASSGGWRADRLAAAGVPVTHVPLGDPGPLAMLRSARLLRGPLRSWRPDVVHTHNVRATAAVHAAGLGRHRPPVLTTVHGLAADRYAPAARLLGRTSALVVAVSDDVRDRLVDAGLPPARVTVVENAVAAHPPAPSDARAGVRAEVGVPGDVPLVLCVARLAPPKRVDLLLDAWDELPAAHLLIAGDGPERRALEHRALERRALEHGGRSRVTFLGDRQDVDRLLAAADVVVLPSDREGMPMAVLEAMAAGVPVVASAVGGLRTLDPAAARLVEPGSAEALAAGIGELLADPGARRRRAAAGRELIAQRYSSARMVEGYRRAYESLTEGVPVVTKSTP